MKVQLSIPTYDGNINFRTVAAIMQAGSEVPFTICFRTGSLLAYTFNSLWVQALNDKEITHFMLLHADIVPEPLFVDKMMRIMEYVKADILSAVVPIKNNTGITSTALEDGNIFKPKRFTLKQLHKMPATFTARGLLVNTGLMLVDIRKDWCRRVHFQMLDKVSWDKKVYSAHCVSEDWLFSHNAAAQNAEIFATREVKVSHVGSADFTNIGGWGSWEIDERHGEAKI